MTSSWGGLGQQAFSRLFRIFGKSEFVLRLKDFLLHGGRLSRVETAASVAKVMRDIEEVKGVRLQRLAAILELMRSAGFTEEEIRQAILKNEDLLDVADSLDTILQYVERGDINIAVNPGIEKGSAIYEYDDSDIQKH